MYCLLDDLFRRNDSMRDMLAVQCEADLAHELLPVHAQTCGPVKLFDDVREYRGLAAACWKHGHHVLRTAIPCIVNSGLVFALVGVKSHSQPINCAVRHNINHAKKNTSAAMLAPSPCRTTIPASKLHRTPRLVIA